MSIATPHPHTPLPWRSSLRSQFDGTLFITIDGPVTPHGYQQIAMVGGRMKPREGFTLSRAEIEGNAALLLQGANHVEALADALSQMICPACRFVIGYPGKRERECPACAQARSVLAAFVQQKV